MRKILFIMPSLSGGGAEKVLLDILNNIDSSIYSIDLLLILNKGIFKNNIPSSVNTIELYRFKICQRIDLYLSKYFSCYFEKKTIRSKLRNKQYDVIVSFLEGDGLRKHQYITSHAKKNITWVHIDLYNFHYTKVNFKKGEEEKIYSLMDEIVFVSKDAKINFIKRFPSNKVQKRIILNPINRIEIQEKSKENVFFFKKKFTICLVGRLVAQKAYDRLLRVARKLKYDGYNLDFIILGDGILKKQLLSLCKEFNLEDTVHFLGFIKNPYPYIKNADIYLNTSSAEGFSLVIGEALCLAKACVATTTAGPVELLQNGKYGLLVGHSDDSIYDGIKYLIDNPEKLNYFEQMAKERSYFFDINNTMREINKLLSL